MTDAADKVSFDLINREIDRTAHADALPLVLTQSPDLRVLPLALWTFQGQYGINVPAILAAVLLTALPILALYIIGRRQLLSGLTAGFTK